MIAETYTVNRKRIQYIPFPIFFIYICLYIYPVVILITVLSYSIKEENFHINYLIGDTDYLRSIQVISQNP